MSFSLIPKYSCAIRVKFIFLLFLNGKKYGCELKCVPVSSYLDAIISVCDRSLNLVIKLSIIGLSRRRINDDYLPASLSFLLKF